MYIEPGTNIRILHNVPLDNTYEHTIYFSSASTQTSYFQGLQKYNLADLTYQRVQRGKARVGIVADNLYDCNYMMFQNANFGTKWFYAFITSVEYINNGCSEITFEIDVIQTWLFSFTLDRCFVEREHTISDAIGQHIEPEGLATGEYIMNTYEAVADLSEMYVIVAVVDIQGQTSVSGRNYNGIYGAATLYAYKSTAVADINTKVAEYVQNSDAIIGIYMCPALIVGTIPDDHILNPLTSGAFTQKTFDALTAGSTTIDGYTPKCNKLYTYPYTMFHVDNAAGSGLDCRYEFFKNGTPNFVITGTMVQPVTVTLRPYNYKGVEPSITNFMPYTAESLQLTNYPICSWAVDSYQAWVAQNAVPVANNIVSGAVLGAIGGAVSGGFVGAGIGAVTSVIGRASNALSQSYSASIAADICKGNTNAGNGNVSSGTQQFYGGRCTITQQYAKMIDDYFNMFGYAIKSCVVPNRSARPHWNYVKTAGCTITGSVPADDMNKICRIHDNGITYWRNGSEIGQYNLDNSPEA